SHLAYHLYYVFMFIVLTVCPSYLFFNAPSTTEIYTLSLHDALPISDIELEVERARLVRSDGGVIEVARRGAGDVEHEEAHHLDQDRKSTRLNSSHEWISYAVFCLKKKTKKTIT